MNKSSKNNRRLLAKNKKDIIVSRLRTSPGSTNLTEVNQTLHFGTQKRKSQENMSKVARAGCKNPSGPTIREQCETYYGIYFNKV